MAEVKRYFSTTGAGADDGTSWANRTALFSAGNWSSVITGFAFNGSDSLTALYGPGSYTCSQALASGLFANAPTAPNSLILHGCDSSGVALVPSDPDWTSDQAVTWDSGLPVIATSTNIATINLANCLVRLGKFTASGRSGAVLGTAGGPFDWVIVDNSTANTAAEAVSISLAMTNSYLRCTGSSYSSILRTNSASETYDNIRVEGVTGSSGLRYGVTYTGTTTIPIYSRITSILNGGVGLAYTGSNAGVATRLIRCTIASNGSDGVLYPNTASQTARQILDRCMITGNGGYGVNPGGANTNILITNSRLRDNASNNFNTFGNYPQDLNNYTTDSDDATEYVSTGGGDFRIKAGSAIHGKGVGVSDQPASSGGTKRRPW